MADSEWFTEWLLNTDPDTMPACWKWPQPPAIEWVEIPVGDRGKLAEEALIAWHQGRCAICGVEPSRLIVDHDHESDLVRGFLCSSCNIVEGRSPKPVHHHYRWCTPADLLDVRLHHVRRRRGYLRWVG